MSSSTPIRKLIPKQSSSSQFSRYAINYGSPNRNMESLFANPDKTCYLLTMISPILMYIVGFLNVNDIRSLYDASWKIHQLINKMCGIHEVLTLPGLFDRYRYMHNNELINESINEAATRLINRFTCRSCESRLVYKRGGLCDSPLCRQACWDCRRTNVPLMRAPGCINTSAYIDRDWEARPRLREYDEEFDNMESGLDCCWKMICRYGCKFVCAAIVKKGDSYVACGKSLYKRPDNDNHLDDVEFAYNIARERLECHECAVISFNTGNGKNFSPGVNNNIHCNQCNLPSCEDPECEGKCDDCGVIPKLTIAPGCPQTALKWNNRYSLSNMHPENLAGCCIKKVCWLGCNLSCTVCTNTITHHALYGEISVWHKRGTVESGLPVPHPHDSGFYKLHNGSLICHTCKDLTMPNAELKHLREWMQCSAEKDKQQQ